MCLTFSHRNASSSIRAPRIFISLPRIISTPLAYAFGAVSKIFLLRFYADNDDCRIVKVNLPAAPVRVHAQGVCHNVAQENPAQLFFIARIGKRREPLAVLKINIPAAFSARRDLESLALLFIQAIQSASRAGTIATAIITPATMTSRISRLARGSASRPDAVRLSAQWERRLDIRFFNLKKCVALNRPSQYRPS